MSIRITVLSVIVAFLSMYAWRDWFRALCGAIVLMAFLQHPDMPRHIFGIVGLNLWNILLINVLIGWAQQQHYEHLEWDAPKNVRVAFLLYCLVTAWAFSRAFLDPTGFYEFDRTTLLINYLVNPLKFLIPGVLLYHGCRTRERVLWGLSAIILLYFLISAEVLRHMGLQIDLSGSELNSKAAKVIHTSTGYHRVDMSMMLAGASWATVIFSQLMISKRLRWACWVGAGTILFAQAMTGGRAGYMTWVLVGLALGLVKWRKLLVLLPITLVMVCIAVPGVRERMLEGFGGREGAYVEGTDSSKITSGRTDMWPYVIEKIKESPLLGYGRLGMIRTGLSDKLEQEVGEGLDHPHNAYLEFFLDNGILGALCALPLYAMIVRRSFRLFKSGEFVLYEVAGGVAFALFLALLFAAFGAQTFYPRESTLGMWAAAGVALRVWVERESGATALLDDAVTDEEADESTVPEVVFQ